MTFKNFGDFSTTAATNTTVDSANVGENCDMSGLNNAIRALAAAGKGASSFVTASGTDTYVAAPLPTPDARATNFVYWVIIANANTVTTPTLQLTTTAAEGALLISALDGGLLWPGALLGYHGFLYDGGSYRVINPNRNRSSGTVASANAGTSLYLSSFDYTYISGTTTITAFDVAPVGTRKTVEFQGALTLTHSSTFQLPGSANITTAAGDVATFASENAVSASWRCIAYQKANGTSVIPSGAWGYVTVSGGTPTLQKNTGIASVTRGSTGIYTVNLSPAMADTNYTATFGLTGVGGKQIIVYESPAVGRTSSAITLNFVDTVAVALADPAAFSVRVTP